MTPLSGKKLYQIMQITAFKGTTTHRLILSGLLDTKSAAAFQIQVQ